MTGGYGVTIVDAIKRVLAQEAGPLTHQQIYEKIVDKNLYVFGASNPAAVVRSQLRRHCVNVVFPSSSPVKHFKAITATKGPTLYTLISAEYDDISPIQNDKDALPEEQIVAMYGNYIEGVKEQLLNRVLAAPAEFFEHLVIKLLVAMGYGISGNHRHTGGPNDGGIDGVIWEDPLELEKIFVQAKRYRRGKKVQPRDIRDFLGAMKGVAKGVFITTSDFTKSAELESITEPLKRVSLIKGEKLIDLMIKYKIGVSVIATYSVYSIDQDFFLDE